jgi:hypothetical protein
MPSHSGLTPRAGLRHSDPASIEARWGLRKIVVQRTQTLADGGTELPRPVNQVIAAAVIRNPWIGQGVDSELVESAQHIAARVSKLLADRLLEALGGVDNIEAFGKGAIIGERGELEHGAAVTHTPYFASHLRRFLDGSAVISFADTRGPAGDLLTVPLCDKHTGIRRDHYQAVRVQLADAPRPDEIVLIAAAADGGRPFPRVGDRSTDLPINTSEMDGVFE